MLTFEPMEDAQRVARRDHGLEANQMHPHPLSFYDFPERAVAFLPARAAPEANNEVPRHRVPGRHFQRFSLTRKVTTQLTTTSNMQINGPTELKNSPRQLIGY